MGRTLTMAGVAFLACIMANVAFAQSTKWVDQAAGLDSNDGDTPGTAYKTLQFAIDNSMSGDAANQSVIYVKDGTYGTTSAGTNPCFPFAPAAIIVQGINYLTIQAAPGENPKIMPPSGDIVSLAIDNSDHIIIDNIDSDQSTAQFDHWHVCNSEDLTVRNSTFEGTNAEDGIDFETGHTTAVIEGNTFGGMIEDTLDFTDGAYSDVWIQDNTFLANERRPVWFFNEFGAISGVTIQRNMFFGTTTSADPQETIRLIGVDAVTVVNNVIMNGDEEGVYIDTGCTNISILHNSFFNNGLNGSGNAEIRTKVASSDILIKNNIIYANGSNKIFQTESGVTSLPGEDYNQVYNSPQTGGGFTFGSNTTVGDPLYVNTTAGSEDLNLQATSPAIDTATDLGVAVDITLKARPVGSDPDRGAYEFGVPVVAMEVTCVGFEPPLDKPISVKKKNRVLPLKMMCFDMDGNELTDLDLVPPPVVVIGFTGGDPTNPPAEEFLSAGQGDDGNQFVYSGSKWQFNLQTKNFSGSGTYTINAVTGDPLVYVIVPAPEAEFVIQ